MVGLVKLTMLMMVHQRRQWQQKKGGDSGGLSVEVMKEVCDGRESLYSADDIKNVRGRLASTPSYVINLYIL